MARVISVFLPTWSTDRVRRKPGETALPVEQPLIITAQVGPRRVVTAADGVAQQLGIRVGMSATKAQVLVPGLEIVEADQKADADALDRLALWALRYAPVVAADHPDGLVIDSAGADHLIGGEQALVDDLVSRLTSSGLMCVSRWRTPRA